MSFGADEYFNRTINRSIFCRDLRNPKTAAYLTVAALQQEMIDGYNSNCSSFNLPPEQQNVYLSRQNLHKLAAPIFIIGAKHDFNVPLEIQQNDYDFLKTVKNNVHFMTLTHAAHMAFKDAPHCMENSIRAFLTLPIVENKSWECADEAN